MIKFWGAGCITGMTLVIGEGILNGLILKEQWALMNASLGLVEPASWVLMLAVAKLFLLGFVAIWLYDIFTYKFGYGAKTACITGLFMGLLIWGWVLLGLLLAGYINLAIALPTFVWGLVELPLAVYLGALLLQGNENNVIEAASGADKV